MEKGILLPKDLSVWKKTSSYLNIMAFISMLNERFGIEFSRNKCDTRQASFKKEDNLEMSLLVDIFTSLKELIHAYPCVPHPRFGNPAFRDWHAAATNIVREKISFLLRSLTFNESKLTVIVQQEYDDKFPDKSDQIATSISLTVNEAIAILSTYLIESFGNSTRIDYGTGHELNFVIFLYCVSLLSTSLGTDDYYRLLTTYFDTIRQLIITYKLEPAGSHGAWGLDDYQFMPFLLGSGQLKQQTCIIPRQSITENITICRCMFFEGIEFITKYKTGPFSHHSPILYDVCTTLTWQQMNQGLFKMYRAEVLEKFPVVQHLYFCKLFPFH